MRKQIVEPSSAAIAEARLQLNSTPMSIEARFVPREEAEDSRVDALRLLLEQATDLVNSGDDAGLQALLHDLSGSLEGAEGERQLQQLVAAFGESPASLLATLLATPASYGPIGVALVDATAVLSREFGFRQVDEDEDGIVANDGNTAGEGAEPVEEGELAHGIRNAEAWADVQLDSFIREEGLRGHGIVVAVIDSGCDLVHPALAGKVRASKDFTPLREPGVPDYTGHGTHCAGQVCAALNGYMVGVAPEASLVIAKTLGKKSLNKPAASHTDTARAIEWCVGQGASVISMSWGYFTSDDRGGVVGRALAKAARQGVVLVAATGNQSRSDEIKFPAKHAAVLGVGNWDADRDGLWRSSNRGEGVFCVAPGRRMWSTDISGGGFRRRTGTSMATAFAAGCMALLLAKFKRDAPAGVSARQLCTMVHQFVRENASDEGQLGRDKAFGHGLLQMRA